MSATSDTTQSKARIRELNGTVVSNAMSGTVVVEVARFVRHRQYGKFISPSKRYKAHDPKNQCALGDTVIIRETRPISKDKRFVVVHRETNE